MPVSKAEFEQLYPCRFSRPEDLLDPDKLYTVPEIARRLQELAPDEELPPEDEAVLIDWAIPWIVHFQDELVVAEPPEPDAPGYYGVRKDEDFGT